MSFNYLNMHCSPLAVKREPLDTSVEVKLEVIDFPHKKSISTMNHTPNSANELLKCKKQRVNFSKLNYSSPHTPPTSVARRNERERNRVKMVNMGFATLRQHVPNGAKNKKMSKVETLRSAVEYIRNLQQQLQGGDSSFNLERYEELFNAVGASSGDENCYPSPVSSVNQNLESSPMESSSNLEQTTYSNQGAYALYNPASSELCNKLTTYNLASSQSALMGARTSPSPSVGSDITSSSSPYNNALLDPASRQTTTVSHEEELFDFSGWF